METTTRIADLPDSTGQYMSQPIQASIQANSREDAITATNYVPINVHSNPYGISAQNPIPPPTAQAADKHVHFDRTTMRDIESQMPQRLPSRDIPRDSQTYTHDEQVTPNYIPRPVVSSDYVRDYEDMTEKNLKEYEAKQRREQKLDTLMTELQLPIVVALLFFLFQLPVVNTMILKTFSFMTLHSADGHFNFYGLACKSMLFGAALYAVQRSAIFINDL